MAWLDWQLLIALACVSGALFVLGRRAARLFTGGAAGGDAASGCGTGGCGHCPAGERSTTRTLPLVSLDLPDSPSRNSRSKPQF